MQVELHDMPGAGERFRLDRFFYKTDAIIFMYSIEDRFTLENLREWYENAAEGVRPDFDKCILALVGNKDDLLLDIEVQNIEAKCEEIGAKLHFFTSAKTGEMVNESLEEVIKKLHKRSLELSVEGASKPSNVILSLDSKTRCS